MRMKLKEKKRGYIKRATEFLNLQCLFEQFGQTHFDSLEEGVRELEQVIEFGKKFLKKYYSWKSKVSSRRNKENENNG